MKSLSILIPSIESRRSMLSELVCGLVIQCGAMKSITSFIEDGCSIVSIGFDGVEIIIATDAKQISTGAKRNLLLRLANNDYIVFCDDDDDVSKEYVSSIKTSIQTGKDVYATNGTITTDGKNEMQWFLSKDNPNITKTIQRKPVYLRTTNHLSPVKKELALKAGFPDKSNAEDKGYSEALVPYLMTEGIITVPLYHYRYSSSNKEY